MTLYDALVNEIRAEFPDFQVVPKTESKLMGAINILLWVFLGGSFMEDFTTTVGLTVYTPTKWSEMSEPSRLGVLRHERVHLRQAKRYGGLVFSLAYVLLPLPFGLAYCRARLEWEAYEESMRAAVEYHGKGALNAEHKAWLVGLFTGPSYGFMWPFRAQVGRWYDASRARILTGS